MIPGLPYETDLPERVGVLVLGSGLAGCGGRVAAAGTDEQVAQGIADSVELLRKDLLETGKHRNDEALVDLYCAHQLETYRWLRGHGVAHGSRIYTGKPGGALVGRAA